MSSTQRPVELGDKYMVAWRNGQKQPGEVIEKRVQKKLAKENASDFKSEVYEYYIHFPNFDRRLDEWVTIDRIDLDSLIAAGDENGHHLKGKLQKRKYEEMGDMKREEKESMLAALEKEHEEITKVKNIQSIILGKYEIETWYFSPYPEEYCGEDKLFVCEYCLKYMKKRKTLRRHFEKCCTKSPPGKLIYSEEDICMYEVDGRDNKIYCQNLCLLSKLFLDHKTLYYDVDPFLFYILCEVDDQGSHIVGYFSKEKQSQENYNLACILTFPPYQRKGYGKFLISMSYELTKREQTTGSPEKPLSDLGKISYRSYWAYVILTFLSQNEQRGENITLQDIGRMTGIRTEDILSTLHCLKFIKYWKGQHVISISARVLENQLSQSKRIRMCNPECLDWQPPDKGLKQRLT
jgi:histone acetyltransferase MYST1